MRLRAALSLTTLFLVLFTVAVWASPQSGEKATEPENGKSSTQSVEGKIAGIGDAEFSVDVLRGQKAERVRFLIDGDTKVEGKLLVGAKASVQYRAEDGTNIAVRVVVTPQAG